MQNITCNLCGKSLSPLGMLTSIQDYGFINLISNDSEILAYYCPEEQCNCLIWKKGPIGTSIAFLNKIEEYSLIENNRFCLDEFKYYSSLPLADRNSESQNGLNAIGYTISIDNYENELGLILSENPELSTDYYCSFTNILAGVMGNALNVWWYKKDNIENLFKKNDYDSLLLIPKYIKRQNLIEKIDDLYWEQYVNKTIFDRSEGSIFSHMVYSWNKNEIDKQYGFLDLLTPPRYFLGKRDDIIINSHHESNYIWKNFHSDYIKEQLLSQSELFFIDYLEQYVKHKFSVAIANKIVSRYRSSIYSGLMSRRKMESSKQDTLNKLIEQVDREAKPFKSIASVYENIQRLKLKLNRLCNNIGNNPSIILLKGETGTGKTTFGNAIHEASGRPGKFIFSNVTEITPSLFESTLFGHKKGAFTGADSDHTGYFKEADCGTLLLDEFGEISIDLQVKLLKAVEEGVVQPVGSSEPVKVNILLVLCTNINFEKAIENGTFRKDLYYRINKFSFEISPLRERKKDILILANRFIKNRAGTFEGKNIAEIGISDEAKQFLLSYQWPGNTRQLQNVIDGLLMLRETDDLSDIGLEEIVSMIPEEQGISFDHDKHDSDTKIRAPPVVKPVVRRAPGKKIMPDKEGIELVLQYIRKKKAKGGVVAEAAMYIGVSERNLREAIKKHKIIPP